MAKICPLFSGSTGNSTYITTVGGDILVDAGASAKSLCAAIDAVGDVSRLVAVAVTHTHTDHIKGLKPFLKKTGLPLVASADVLSALATADAIPTGIKTIVADGADIALGDISLTYFPTSHDSTGSGGYVITMPDGRRAAVCTDLGVVTDTVREALAGCEAVLLESNHDIEMLKRGPYPPQLKLRILSDSGHLSNNACAAELPTLLKSGTTRIILGHLSMHNNMPQLALSAAKGTLADIGACVGSDCILKVAKPTDNEVTVF